ncbi:MAG: MFS transporter [Clostridia bacterium]|nr:MFS transporter [Clostridia bacterium]
MGNTRKIDYKWIIVALLFLMTMISLGFCSSTRSLYIAPITAALHIKRGAFSVNDSLRFVTTAVVSVFSGVLIGRFGLKKLIMTGLASIIASQLVYSVAENVIVFYIGGILLGLGFALTGTTMVGCVVNRWCKESKGKIMGAVFAANGIGGALAIQAVTPIIEQGAFGYRNAYRLAAVILIAVWLLMFLFFREKATNSDNAEKETAKKKSRGRDWIGIDYKNAVREPYFYVAIVCIFFTGFALQGVNGVAAAHMKDVGIDPIYVGRVLSIHSLVLTLAKFITGHSYDRFGLKTTINFCAVVAIVVMMLISALTNSHMGMIFAMLYGILSAFALPLETIMLPIYAGDLFGQKSFEKVLGIFTAANVTGYASGAPVINICYDISGSYRIGFIICAVIMSVTLITLQFVIRAAHRKQKEIMIESNEF